jgi:purine-binding chemotaxis protein CheW
MAQRVIDWESLQRRLAATAAAISGGLSHTPEETRRILATRAAALAKPPARPDDTQRLEVLAFSLAGESFGVETSYVREACQLRDLTALPCTPPFIAGVMNLRGQILAVVDLRKLFELPAKGITELNRVLVLAAGGAELGLLADSIDGVRSVAAAELQEGLPTLTGIRERFLKGITGTMLAVLDGGRLLSDAGLTVNEQVAKQTR